VFIMTDVEEWKHKLKRKLLRILGPEDMKMIPVEAIKGLTPEQIRSLTPEQIKSVLENLPLEQLKEILKDVLSE